MKKFVAIILALAIITTCVACAQDMTSGEFQKEFEKFDWENSSQNAVSMEAERLLGMLEDLPTETQKTLSDVREKLEDYKLDANKTDDENKGENKDEIMGEDGMIGDDIMGEDGMMGDGIMGEDGMLGDLMTEDEKGEMENTDKSLLSAKKSTEKSEERKLAENADKSQMKGDKIARPERPEKSASPEKSARPERPIRNAKPDNAKKPIRPLPDARR